MGISVDKCKQYAQQDDGIVVYNGDYGSMRGGASPVTYTKLSGNICVYATKDVYQPFALKCRSFTKAKQTYLDVEGGEMFCMINAEQSERASLQQWCTSQSGSFSDYTCTLDGPVITYYGVDVGSGSCLIKGGIRDRTTHSCHCPSGKTPIGECNEDGYFYCCK